MQTTPALRRLISCLPFLMLATTVHAATFQAESAALSGGASTATDHTGYTGSGFVGGFVDGNKGNAQTNFTVNAATAGNYTLKLRYANGTGSAKTLTLYVDGVSKGQVSLGATANWDDWLVQTTTVALTAGNHSIAYKFTGADSGNVNLDKLDVDAVVTGSGGREAENATLSGGAVVATDHTGYQGSGFVGGFTDGNKGNAQVAFAVTAASASSHSLSLRYANGTGAAKTLTVYVDGASAGQVTLPATANWDTWATQTSTVTLSAGAHTVAYKFTTSDSGNVNLDALDVAAVTGGGNPNVTPAEAETWFMSGGAAVSTSVSGYNGSGYAAGFSSSGARAIRTVFMSGDGSATASLRYLNTSGSARTLDVIVNAAKVGTVSIPASSTWATLSLPLTLRTGHNTVGLQSASAGADVGIDSLSVAGELTAAARGATVRTTLYEAEAASTNATVMTAGRTPFTVQSESSGRSLVRLSNTGHQVSFTTTQPTNSLVLRYSIPDAPGGGGQSATLALYANGTKVQDLTLTSTYAWVYGAYPFRDVPSDGTPRHFYDEIHVPLASYPAGTVFKLQKDGGNTAAYYDIDFIETEVVPAAYAMPAGAFSITSYGAVSGGGDATSAFQQAIAAAQPSGGVVWIPAGTFKLSSRINISGVTMRGAGPWYSTVELGNDGHGGLYGTGNNVKLADFLMLGKVTLRDPDGQVMTDAPLEGNFGTGSMFQNLWFEHTKVGMWIDSGTNGLYASGLRIRNTFADGVNIHANVQNVVMDQSVVRNTGDDALAMFSEGAAVTNSAYLRNTVQSPVLANGIGIYGGYGNRAEYNVISDTVVGSSGITVSSRFSPVPFSGTTRITGNTLVRTGGFEPNWNDQFGALFLFADTSSITAPLVIKDLVIQDSTYSGIYISGPNQVQGALFDGVTITGAGTYGIQIKSGGNATFQNVTVSGAAQGGLSNTGGFTLNRGSGNSGF
ncbi:carbohydrate-binding protein [Roseateles sp. NT4]|uniref:carbohydrate-binding protein n=1 Tax=Roseateles sp. NT4 TaxID=3453715 RepID=UPI003EEDCE50